MSDRELTPLSKLHEARKNFVPSQLPDSHFYPNLTGRGPVLPGQKYEGYRERKNLPTSDEARPFGTKLREFFDNLFGDGTLTENLNSQHLPAEQTGERFSTTLKSIVRTKLDSATSRLRALLRK